MTDTQATTGDKEIVFYMRRRIMQMTGHESFWRFHLRPLAYTKAYDDMVCMAYGVTESQLTTEIRRRAWAALLAACEDKEAT